MIQLKVNLMKTSCEVKDSGSICFGPTTHKIVHISAPENLEKLLDEGYIITSIKTEGASNNNECRVFGGE